LLAAGEVRALSFSAYPYQTLMANLNPDDVLLVVCSVLTRFGDEKLVIEDENGREKPVPGASEIKIARELRTIAANDERDGAHSISFIREGILDGVEQLGYSVILSPSQLINGEFETIGHLVEHLMASSSEILA
jgi:hypothetical protein